MAFPFKRCWRSGWLTQKKKKDESSQRLKDILIEELTPRDSDTKREIPIMTRLDNKHVNMLDILVKLGIFRSRSEVAAAIIEKALFEHRDTFKQLNAHIIKLEKIQDMAKEIAHNVFK